MNTRKKRLYCSMAAGLGLSIIASAANAASWGVTYDGYGLSGYPCSPGHWVWDPIFTIYTISAPSDWPAYSQFGHQLEYAGNIIYADSRTNDADGESLVRTGTIPAYGQAYAYRAVSSLHWGIYNGTYVSATSSAGGWASACF